MSIETPPNAIEATILADLKDLHQAMYDKMASITGVTGLQFLGFDTGKTKEPLPEIAMAISMDALDIDRRRPTPAEAHRVILADGLEIVGSYGGATYTGLDGSTIKYPLPVTIGYNITTWCYDVQTQLAMFQKLMQKFPERGVVTLSIGGEPFDFPIELVGIDNLDDGAQNIRERIHRYKVEAWIDSHIPDGVVKIITSSEISVYEGNKPEDIEKPENEEPLLSVKLEADK